MLSVIPKEYPSQRSRSPRPNHILPDPSEWSSSPVNPKESASTSSGHDGQSFTFEPFVESNFASELSEAESLAVKLLQQGRCKSSDLLNLSLLLPNESTARQSAGAQAGSSFITGAFRHGGVTGPRKSLEMYPACSRLLVSVAKSIFPKVRFTSLGLFRNVQTPRHCDKNNLAGSHNHIAALTPFSGGGVRVHRADSTEDLNFTASRTLQFDAHFDHETLPWSDGDRLVLVVFSVGCIENLEPEAFNHLHSFGIPLPCDMRHAKPSELTTTGEPDLGMCLEIFSGSARLSMAMQEAGFQVLAFDHKAGPAFPTQLLDLTTPDHQDALCEIVVDNASRLQHIHIVPPCGTCSAARERPIPGFKEAGLASPAPLRDSAHPMGLPSLQGSDLIRVTQANCLYKFVCRLVRLAKSLGIAVSIENPGNPLRASVG